MSFLTELKREKDVLVGNIINSYSQASLQHIADGEAWYPTAKSFVEEIGRYYHRPIDESAAIVATLSPRMTWSANLNVAVKFYEIVTKSKPRVNVGLGLQSRKAYNIFDTGQIDKYLTGVKVQSFYNSILGDKNDPVIDTWAIRVLLSVPTFSKTIKPNIYRFAQQCYVSAAEILNSYPSSVQAVTWTFFREYHGKKRSM